MLDAPASGSRFERLDHHLEIRSAPAALPLNALAPPENSKSGGDGDLISVAERESSHAKGRSIGIAATGALLNSASERKLRTEAHTLATAGDSR